MKKDLFKRKVATAVACVMTFSALALAGCKDSGIIKGSTMNFIETVLPSGSYVVVDGTLHKAGVYSEHPNYDTTSPLLRVEMECRNEPVWIDPYYVQGYGQEKPASSNYTDICECAQ